MGQFVYNIDRPKDVIHYRAYGGMTEKNDAVGHLSKRWQMARGHQGADAGGALQIQA